MSSLQLTQEFLNHFSISEYRQVPGVSGQKTVFIVKIESVEYALKILRFADERFQREVEICTKFNHLSGIPSIIKVEKFASETIILEQYIEGCGPF